MKSETIKSDSTKKIREFIVHFVEDDKLLGKSIPFFSISLAGASVSIGFRGKIKREFENLKPNELVKVTFEKISNFKNNENETARSLSNTKYLWKDIVYLVRDDKLFGRRFSFLPIVLAKINLNKTFNFPPIGIKLFKESKKGFENLKPLEPIKVTFERVSKEGEENEK